MNAHIGALAGCAAVLMVSVGMVAEKPKDADPKRLEAIVQGSSGAICRIVAYDARSVPLGQGSGFLLESGEVGSCAHVIRGASSATANFGKDEVIDVDGVVAFDADRDLALLSLKTPPKAIKGLTLCDLSVPTIGTEVVAIGYPLSLALTVSKGIITSLPTGEDFNRSTGIPLCPADMRLIQTDAAISHGNSGGPLMMMDGSVLAVMALIQPKGQNISFGIPAAYLRTMLSAKKPPVPLASLAASTVVRNPLRPILPPRKTKVTVADVTGAIAGIIRLTTCPLCRGAGKVDVRVVRKDGSDWNEKRVCPQCHGAEHLTTIKPGAYQHLANLGEALVYLDTEATTVTAKQAAQIRTALLEAIDRVGLSGLPRSHVEKTASMLRRASEEPPGGVCFAATVMGKVSTDDRDYFLAKVADSSSAPVAIVCPRGKFSLTGAYIILGVAGGGFTSDDRSKVAFVWPAVLIRPNRLEYLVFQDGSLLRLGRPKTVEITVDAL